MEWIRKHTDTVIVLGGILGAVLWMNGKFNDVDRRLVKIETIMYIKGFIQSEIASNNLKENGK